MSFNQKKAYLKILKAYITFLALPFSFLVLFFCFNIVTGDLPALTYGGIIHPDMMRGDMSQDSYNQALAAYERIKNEQGIPGFPFNFIYLIVKFATFDWGTDWMSGEPILDVLIRLSGPTLILLITCLVVISAVLLPFMLLKYEAPNEIYGHSSSSSSNIFRIFAILSPFLLIIGVLSFFMVINGILPIEFVTLGWRDNAFILANLVLPVILISSMALPFGLISLTFGASNRTALKISFVTAVIAEIFTEIFFSWPGIGRYVDRALWVRNYPVLFAGFFLISLVIVFSLVILELVPSSFLDVPVKKVLSQEKTSQSSISFGTDPEKIIAGALIIFILFLTFSFLLAPFHPTEDNYLTGNPPFALPGGDFLLGTNWMGNDLFSRLLFSSRNIVLYLFAPIVAVGGFLVSRQITTDIKQWITQAMSFVVILVIITLFGVLVSLQDFFWITMKLDSFFISNICISVFLGFPLGFILGTWINDQSPSNLIRNIRGVFSITLLLQFILMEFLSFNGLGIRFNDVSFGVDLLIARSTFFSYEHLLWTPLIAFVLIAVILAFFALIKIPFKEPIKAIKHQTDKDWSIASENDYS